MNTESNYRGDEIYSIQCTGDAVVGDDVCFERATFDGSFRKPKFAGFEKIAGKIIKDSYGKDKQQHTFTLHLVDNSIICIKGRNLYREGTWRKPWEDESKRQIQLDEKHERGNDARRERSERRLHSSY